MANLKDLSITRTAVTNAGLEYLKSMPALEFVNIKGFRVPWDASRESKLAMPKMKVSSFRLCPDSNASELSNR
jgi:hypothetical protein